MNMLTIASPALRLVLLLWLAAPVAAAADFQVYSAAKRDHTPAVAYNSQTNQYFVVWHQGTGVGLTAVMAQRVDASGAAVGGPTEIVTYAFDSSRVSVAYNAAQNEFLVVYATGILPDTAVYGVTPDAKASRGNQLAGIKISGSSLNFIGFLDTASANIIGGNGASGIVLSDTSRFNVVSVNCVGTGHYRGKHDRSERECCAKERSLHL